MDYEHFLLILQSLKERALELQSEIEKTRELNNPEDERSRLNSLQKELIAVMPMMSLVRTLVKMEALYRSSGSEETSLVTPKAGGLNKAKQAEIRVSFVQVFFFMSSSQNQKLKCVLKIMFGVDFPPQ